MPIFGAELAEVAPEQPRAVAVEGDYICTINYPNSDAGLMPNGSYVIMDTTTETARAFTGLGTSTSTSASDSPVTSVVGHAGYFWVQQFNGRAITRITPSTGALTTYSMVRGQLYPFALGAGMGDYLAFFSATNAFGYGHQVWQISTTTSAQAGTFALGGVWALAPCSDGYFYVKATSGSTWHKMDPTAPNTSVASASGGGYRHGVEYGGYLWFQNSTGIVRLDFGLFPAAGTFTTYSHTGVAGGNYATTSDLVLGADNWLYGYGASDYLIGFDPATGTFGKEPLSPTRGRRYTIASCNGKLWIPSGEPLT